MLIFRNKGQGYTTNTKNQMTQNCNWSSTYLVDSKQLDMHDEGANQMLVWIYSEFFYFKKNWALHFEVFIFSFKKWKKIESPSI